MKEIKIFTGNCNIDILYEQGLHPKNQIKKVIEDLKKDTNLHKIYTNSPFVAEAFNKYGKEKDYKIQTYFNNNKIKKEEMFHKFSEPFSKLIFD